MYFTGIADEAGRDITTQIQAHKELGWQHLELRMVDEANIACLPDDEFEAIYGAVTEAGLRVSGIAAKIGDWSRPVRGNFLFDQNDLIRAIKRMKRLGTKFIRVMTWPNDKARPLDEKEWRDRAIKRLQRLVSIAEHHDIILAHENCSGWGGISAANNVALLEAISSPNLGVLFDTGNPPTYGQDSLAWYQAVKHRIVYVHIKDAKKVDGEDEYKFPGEGDGCVRQIVGDLVERGYDGYLSIEPHLAAVIHTGKAAVDATLLYESYVEYGRRLMQLVADLKSAKPA